MGVHRRVRAGRCGSHISTLRAILRRIQRPFRLVFGALQSLCIGVWSCGASAVAAAGEGADFVPNPEHGAAVRVRGDYDMDERG